MTYRVTFTRIGNPYKSWLVGCDVCKRRLHVDSLGYLRAHNVSKGVGCEGSFTQPTEFIERRDRMECAL